MGSLLSSTAKDLFQYTNLIFLLVTYLTFLPVFILVTRFPILALYVFPIAGSFLFIINVVMRKRLLSVKQGNVSGSYYSYFDTLTLIVRRYLFQMLFFMFWSFIKIFFVFIGVGMVGSIISYLFTGNFLDINAGFSFSLGSNSTHFEGNGPMSILIPTVSILVGGFIYCIVNLVSKVFLVFSTMIDCQVSFREARYRSYEMLKPCKWFVFMVLLAILAFMMVVHFIALCLLKFFFSFESYIFLTMFSFLLSVFRIYLELLITNTYLRLKSNEVVNS